MIPGGYILQPRCIDNSTFMNEAPLTRELWFYLLRNVNYADNGQYRRGSGFFNYNQIRQALGYNVGYAFKTFTRDRISKSMRRLRDRGMIETTKATRGVIVIICKYDYYQSPKNYEGNNEGNMKAIRKRESGYTKNKKENNEENPFKESFLQNPGLHDPETRRRFNYRDSSEI